MSTQSIFAIVADHYAAASDPALSRTYREVEALVQYGRATAGALVWACDVLIEHYADATEADAARRSTLTELREIAAQHAPPPDGDSELVDPEAAAYHRRRGEKMDRQDIITVWEAVAKTLAVLAFQASLGRQDRRAEAMATRWGAEHNILAAARR